MSVAFAFAGCKRRDRILRREPTNGGIERHMGTAAIELTEPTAAAQRRAAAGRPAECRARRARRPIRSRAAVPTGGQALVHLLVRASIEGRIVRGPIVG